MKRSANHRRTARLKRLLALEKHMQTKLAKRLGISVQAVNKWHDIPTEHVLAIEEFTGMSRFEQRPDIYGVSPANFSEPVALPLAG